MLGEKIRNLRKENNISQEKLAEELNVTRQSISLWENDQTQPSLENVVALAKIFNTSVDDLLSDSKEENTKEVVANGNQPLKTHKSLFVWILISACIVSFIVVLLFLKPWSNDSENTTALQPEDKTSSTKPFSENVDAIAEKEASVVKIFCYDHNGQEISTGSGVILFSDDMVATNYHVIEDAYSVKISTSQDITYNVSGLWNENEYNDTAILKLEKNTNLTPLIIGDSSLVKKGETVTAIGSPLGIKNSVSKGNLSARIMQENYDILQFTAPISSGSSGGALFNEKGELIGITFASFEDGQNLNLAIPIELVKNLYHPSLSLKPKPFKDIYWNNYITNNPEEYLAQKYGSVISVSFSELKNNPEKYSDKLVKVEGFISSFDSFANRVRIETYIASKKTTSSYDEDDEKYSSKDYTQHDLIAISPLAVGDRIYRIDTGNIKDKVLITGVFKKDSDGDYRIFAKTIMVL